MLFTSIWNLICSDQNVRSFNHGDVMGQSIYRREMQYAIIQTSSNADCPERLVISYPDEKCLRSLIAAPSIVGLGFPSREEAIANSDAEMRSIPISKQKSRSSASDLRARRDDQLKESGTLLSNGIAKRVTQYALSTLCLLFYSKNLLLATIRIALGASF